MLAFQRRFGAALAMSADPDVRLMDGALARALAVHRNTSAKAARDALAANYPVVRALCGDGAFDGCAAAYVRSHPSREARLNAFGEDFDTFLRGYEPARGVAYLPDIARLERLLTESLFAADAEPAGAAQIAQMIAVGALPHLHPATRFESFSSPAVSIVLAHQALDEAAFGAIGWTPEDALITRPVDGIRSAVAAPGALAFLQACKAGADLSAAVMAADQAGADFSVLLPPLIEAGAFASTSPARNC
jgi:hypothetical protein